VKALDPVLIANRGEIALRVMRTARTLGLRAIAVYSDADRDAPHVRSADAAVWIGGSSPRESYLSLGAILEAAQRSGARSLHPGYGFLAESAGFAQAVIDAGLVWIGPPPAAIRAMGDKAQAKRLMAAAGVPVLPTYEHDPEFPVMVKAVAGGGGRGMRWVVSESELKAAIEQARSEAEHAFGDGRVILEKAIENARHVEVQIFSDSHGNCVHLGERDCSVQRRHQKLIEESPCPAVDAELRARLGEAAVAAARAVGYAGAGTVEFLLAPGGAFWFMEMNTRLQVEHPVTEAVTGLDLVEWQLRVAAGEPLPLAQDAIRFSGHAIEARLCAEDVESGFLPRSGVLELWEPAAGVRIEHALESGIEIRPFYDSMIAKLIAHGATRDAARLGLAAALDATVALGVPTNKSFLAAVLRDESFARGEACTDFLSKRSFPESGRRDPDYALAATLLARAARFGEWTGWSNNPEHGMRVRFDGRDLAFRYRELPLPSGPIPFVVDGATVHFAAGGRSVTLENTRHAPPEKRAGHAGDGRLAAPMNGRVVAVHAREGARMEAGQPLVVLEAMKMEHGLSVPVAVTVKSVHVRAGIQVSPGHLLLEYEPAAAGALRG
jgi:geranyl-CoA carboxylase alpha subunit